MFSVASAYEATSSVFRVPSANKRLLLLAWLALHGFAISFLFYIGSNLGTAYTANGWTAATKMIVLLVLNVFLYGRLYYFKHAAVGSQDTWQSSIKSNLDVSVSMSSVHPPTWSPATAKARNTSAGHESLPLTAVDSSTCHYKQFSDCYSCHAAVRAHHCKDCGTCIQGFDHHCYWLGTCIGDSNHGMFWCYLLSQTALCLYGLHQGLTAWRHAAHVGVWGLQQWSALVYTAVLWLLSLFTGGLLAFHTFLILSNWKTYELLKGHMVPSPFDHGPARNLYNFLLHRQVYNTLVDEGCMETQLGLLETIWDNSWYSCC